MGKVHGSLARAGKVKSQTPKVRYISESGGRKKEKGSMEVDGGLRHLKKATINYEKMELGNRICDVKE